MTPRIDDKLETARRLLDSGVCPLPELAEQVGWSPAYLQKRFKQAFGLSPAEYAAQRKVAALKQHLKHAPDVTQAWVDSGFGSSSRVYENGAAKLGMLPAVYRKGGAGMTIHWTITPTVLGKALVAATERGICAVALAADPAHLLAELRTEFPNAVLNHVPDDDGIIAVKVRSVAEALAGKTPAAPIELIGTAFQHRVWQALMTIPRGSTLSYAELAERLAMPSAARAVARACAGNRVAVLVPCHRIIRGDGSLGGYRWGLPVKEDLLRRERNGAAGK
ncbi:methylated-DNA--[protein]-cysteine S-methyltransferase [Arenimonas sp. GDDSR-1]|uniref:bifunctional transcriptional activator/DNA repair enzyme AdaA n=1 Tax=Arenimonas sp. GDDSR-1 TaxID=2950125 RepID=UPI002618FAC9|nr:methylated-DNA--[protein]-cysteine S-methyltransferase [Arenimonas sp. GDDSR-1]